MENKDDFATLLVKDFDDFSRGELQILRNRIRQRYKYPIEVKIDATMLYHGYLILKRDLVTTLETLQVCPYPAETHKSSFTGETLTFAPVVVPTFDGIFGSPTDSFTITGYITLPVLTVSYFDDYTEVTCLSPGGNFCKIRSKNLLFDI